MKTTQELEKLLKSSKNYTSFAASAEEALLPEENAGAVLLPLLASKKLKKSDVIRASGLDKGYAYDIFSGKKKATRDKILMLCLGAALSAEETQTLLRRCGYPALYAKLPRDSALLFAFEHRLSVIEANDLLDSLSLALLE